MGGLQGGGKGDPRGGGSTVDKEGDRGSTCAQVGSMLNGGIWNAQRKTWEGSAIPRTMDGDEAHYTAFLLGTPSLQAAGCRIATNLEIAACPGPLVHFAVDDGHGQLARGVC